MKDLIESRLSQLSREIEALIQEQNLLRSRGNEIEIRMHQLVGAIYELNQLLASQGNQPSDETPEIEEPLALPNS